MEAVELLLKEYSSKGIKFVTISELLKLNQPQQNKVTAH